MADEKPSVDSVFCAAIEIESAEERQEYVAKACGQDSGLLRQVDRLLRAHFGAGSFLESPPDGVAPSPTIDQPITEKPGTQIGPYKLLQQIGEGGMGVVYMAEQKEPVKRRVALKIIKPGMDTRQVIARFEAERQALAMMDHPNIAKVLDAGATESGRPYFVMELVNGLPVTKYCDEQHLTPKERLELFVPICQAVQHAHQKGIIHRDLKPSNILVAMYDNKAIPKIIDFGVAKATSQTLTDKTMFTQLGQVVGTLEYMSPEQAQRNQLDIDTRSDIYSLGVVLYELLTGETPFDGERLRSAAFDEMLRIIREEEPPKPSTRLSSSESLPSIAANRQIEPQKLSTLVRGELDWIVMKALEKDRGRRYETASKFAEDVQRYLINEPVEACPPSAVYRVRKFVRRNRAPVLAATLLLAALVAGTTGTSVGLWRSITARRDAVEARNDANLEAKRTRRALAVAERRFKLAKSAVDQYLNQVVASDKLKQAGLVDLRRQLLEAAIPFYEKLVAERPGDEQQEAQQAEAYGRLSSLRALMGDHAQARVACEKMLEIYQRLSRAAPEQVDYVVGVAVAKNNLALRCKALGEPNQARGFFEEAAETWYSLVHRDDLDEDQRRHVRYQLSKCQGNLGDLLREMGERSTARQMLEKSLATRRELIRSSPDVPKYRADLVSGLASLALFLKDFDSQAALQTLDEAISVQQLLCDKYPKESEYRQALCACLNNQALLLRRFGRHDDARRVYERTLQIRQKLANDFLDVPRYRAELATSYNNLGRLLREIGHRDDARKVFEQSRMELQKLVKTFPNVPEHRFDMALTASNLAIVLHELGHDDDSQNMAEKAIAGLEWLSQSNAEVEAYRFELASNYLLHADLLTDAGDFEAARRAIERGRDHYERLAIATPAVTAYRHGVAASWNALGDVLCELGQKDDAIAAHEKAIELFEQLAEESPRSAEVIVSLAIALAAASDLYDDQQRKERNATRAVGLLRELAQQGFDPGVLIEQIRVNQPLHQLRSRVEMRTFLEELENWDIGSLRRPDPG